MVRSEDKMKETPLCTAEMMGKIECFSSGHMDFIHWEILLKISPLLKANMFPWKFMNLL